jgi:hypothetical protein
MTATSVLSPTAATRSWYAVQRTVAMLFVVAVFATLAFTAGRASVHVHRDSPVITPPVLSVPAPADAYRCYSGRPC